MTNQLLPLPASPLPPIASPSTTPPLTHKNHRMEVGERTEEEMGVAVALAVAVAVAMVAVALAVAVAWQWRLRWLWQW